MLEPFDGVYLASIEPGHLEHMRAARNDVRVRRWCRQNSLITASQQREWYERLCKDQSQRLFAIMGETSGFVGVGGLTSIDWVNGRAEFSLYIIPELHEKGLGNKALVCIIRHAFLDMGLEQVWGETFHTNAAARACFKKVGFRETGIKPKFYYKDGQWLDAIHCCIFREGWPSDSSASIPNCS